MSLVVDGRAFLRQMGHKVGQLLGIGVAQGSLRW